MKHFLIALIALFVTIALTVPDAEARRLGGGRSSGMQRDSYQKRDAQPQPAPAKPQPGVTPNTPPKRSWLGPLAGLAAGIGLAALFSHFGMGEGMANFLMLALLGLGAFLLIRWFLGRTQARPMQYAGASNTDQPARLEAADALPGSVSAMAPPAGGLPPGFDADVFVRQAKVNFLRMQAANDTGNLDDIRAFTSPEMYAEIKLDLDERHGAQQRTDVTLLNAEVLDAVEEANRLVVSVRFHGLMREDSELATPFDETWHLTKPAQGDSGWVVAGIQQNS